MMEKNFRERSIDGASAPFRTDSAFWFRENEDRDLSPDSDGSRVSLPPCCLAIILDTE